MAQQFGDRRQFDPDLPLVAVPGGHHTCRMCGGGCRSYDVLLTEQEARRLSLPMWRAYLHDVPDDAPLVLLDEASGQFTLNKVGGRCVFLDTDNLCIIHKEADAATKPLACQFFPLLAIQTPTETRVSLNVGCRRLIEMSEADAPLRAEDARPILAQVHSVTTIPPEVAFTPGNLIPFEALAGWCTRLTALLTADSSAPDRLRAAALALLPTADTHPAPNPRALFRDLRRLAAAAPPVRPTLNALYTRSLPWLDALIEAPALRAEWPTLFDTFFTSACAQHLEGYQFALHRTARTGLVAFLAALTCAPVAANQRILNQDQPTRPEHAWNEALSDVIDLFLTPAGQIALTEPNQQGFLQEISQPL